MGVVGKLTHVLLSAIVPLCGKHQSFLLLHEGMWRWHCGRLARSTGASVLRRIVFPAGELCADYGCESGWQGDGVCDEACNNTACNFDDGDCECYTAMLRARIEKHRCPL